MIGNLNISEREYDQAFAEISGGLLIESSDDDLGHYLTVSYLFAEGYHDADLEVKQLQRTFAIEIKSASSTDRIIPAIKQLKSITENRDHVIPVLAVPFMRKAGQKLCAEEKINWFDLSGNIHLEAPGFKIIIEGKPNRYKHPGRPSNVFAPKSSRITRQFLLNPHQQLTQSDLVKKTNLDKGFVSRVVRKLFDSNLIIRNEDGTYRALDPSQLFKAWYDSYDFTIHRIIKGHIPSRTGEQLLKRIVDHLKREDILCWATGLASAWLYTHHATFRITSVYLKDLPEKQILKDMGFVDEPRGANTWLIIPKDEGVLDGAKELSGITCVSPLQTYLDLKGHPERSKEAAVELNKQYLSWSISND